jgi:hypothetical protein
MGGMKDVLEPPPATADSPIASRLSLSSVWTITAILLPVVAALEASLSSVDLAYQVRAGNLMLDTHELVRTDTFTFTAAGRPWLDQQWFAQVVFALVHRAGGWAALHLLRAALVGAIFLFVFLACRAAGAPVKRSAWLTLAAFVVSVGGLALRPQLIGMSLFAATVYLVAARHRHPRAVWLVPLLVAAWANIHGSFFLGPVLAGLAFLQDVHVRSPARNRMLTVTAASVAAATLNPFGIRVWSYAASLSTNHVITRFVSEWQPPQLRDVPGAIFFLSALGVVAFLARRPVPAPWPALLSFGLFFVIGLVAIRGIFWWALIAPVLLAELTADRSETTTQPSFGSPPANLGIVALLAILAVVALPWWRAANPLATPTELVSDAPAGVTAELRRDLSPGDRIFGPQLWGSWLEFALPEYPVAVDSRIEVIPTSVWTAYSNISFGRQGWQQLLDRWKVSAIVAHRDQQRELIPLLRGDPGWRLVYEDRRGLVFVRT